MRTVLIVADAKDREPADPVNQSYVYRGDRLSADRWRRAPCDAVRDHRGKCIRGRNGNMLVRFRGGDLVVVLGRQLRKM